MRIANEEVFNKNQLHVALFQGLLSNLDVILPYNCGWWNQVEILNNKKLLTAALMRSHKWLIANAPAAINKEIHSESTICKTELA